MSFLVIQCFSVLIYIRDLFLCFALIQGKGNDDFFFFFLSSDSSYFLLIPNFLNKKNIKNKK